MDILEQVKVNLRIISDKFDEAEIKPLIEAAKEELKAAGVKEMDMQDPLAQRAIVLYCKANFGFASDSEKYMAAYEKLRDAMALSKKRGMAEEKSREIR